VPEEFLAALDRVERLYLEDLVKIDDMHEGIAAFTERRKPVWKHR
jgi:enoyl-CoA hydratase/carnithine racemase